MIKHRAAAPPRGESSNNCVKLIFINAKHAENQFFASSAPLRETHQREYSR
jgi:hypothetical protein